MAAIIPYAAAVKLSFGVASRAEGRCDPDRDEAHSAAAGDEAAFEALVHRHQRALFNLALRYLGDRDEAQDAVQDTFLRAWRALPRFRGEAMFRTWITGIAINVCRSRLAGAEARCRRQTQSLVQPDGDGGAEVDLPLPDPSPGPAELARGGELRAALTKALAALSPEHREVLLLREMNGMEYEEVAAVLGCALGTVKSRIARARGALREALEGVWP